MSEKIQIKPTTSDFSASFRKIKQKLSKKLKNVEIHHVGSTAIPNLGGKNFLDVLIVCTKKSDVSTINEQLQAEGFEFKEETRYDERLFFKKKEENWIHIHLTWKATSEEKSFLGLRDYLLANPDEAKKYYLVKRKIIKQVNGNRAKYVELKAEYVSELLKQIKSI